MKPEFVEIADELDTLRDLVDIATMLTTHSEIEIIKKSPLKTLLMDTQRRVIEMRNMLEENDE